MKEKYGDMIVTSTYPDNFDKETETVISNAVAMASDPDVKAIDVDIQGSRECMERGRAALQGVDRAFLKDLTDQRLLHTAVGSEEHGVFAVFLDLARNMHSRLP